jgi:SAM-dependent methyltransferase
MLSNIEFHQRYTEQAAWTKEARNLFIQSTGLSPKSRMLEVGCGTGAVIASFEESFDLQFFGIDKDLDKMRFASHISPERSFVTGNADYLPFPVNYFDAVYCHYLLLWVNQPQFVLAEMKRTLRPGGYLAILAEPDYGSRIDYPEIFVEYGRSQRNSLLQQGANPDIGRKTGELLATLGLNEVYVGILGSFQSSKSLLINQKNEQKTWLQDVQGLMAEDKLRDILEKDRNSWKTGNRVCFIPTFYGWGRKPEENHS